MSYTINESRKTTNLSTDLRGNDTDVVPMSKSSHPCTVCSYYQKRRRVNCDFSLCEWVSNEIVRK